MNFTLSASNEKSWYSQLKPGKRIASRRTHAQLRLVRALAQQAQRELAEGQLHQAALAAAQVRAQLHRELRQLELHCKAITRLLTCLVVRYSTPENDARLI